MNRVLGALSVGADGGAVVFAGGGLVAPEAGAVNDDVRDLMLCSATRYASASRGSHPM